MCACACVCAQQRLCAHLCRRVLVHVCVRVYLFPNKDKSTLNKSTSHYGEALIRRSSHLSCFTDVLPTSLPSYVPRLPRLCFCLTSNRVLSSFAAARICCEMRRNLVGIGWKKAFFRKGKSVVPTCVSGTTVVLNVKSNSKRKPIF